jgi:hypothetical protein
MKFIKSGNTWSLTPDARMDVRDKLPVGNYTVCQNPMTKEYYLEMGESFVLPPKLYGKTERHGDRILKTFENRNPGSQVGVFLSGTKGSGKTLLAKYIANRSELPVIIVNAPFTDDRFMRTIQGIEQPAVILFDEFEKLYNKEDQESILTLFDGVYTAQNKVMVITCNDKWAVREFFHNRPSRLRYSIAFEGLEPAFVEEYCADRLDDRKYLKNIVTLCGTCDEFNFDMLQTLVDELNRYGGSFEDTLDILNVKPISGARAKWVVTVETPDEPRTKWKVTYNETMTRSPLLYLQGGLHGQGYLEIITSRVDRSSSDEDEIEDEYTLQLRSEHIYKVDPMSGVLTLRKNQDGQNFLVTITEDRNTGSRWGSFYERDAF